ncbi:MULTISPECIES: hypothetical protein [Cyanophyceae]|uniref:hypothetical protein n=1 Tax=Cyanophyceae TaxID=3028117 RepID=UPI0016882469|nr:hypothetical protein [Trichocoleus sp. FACHB-69]MBD1934222.1 hypothetical protein [Trichocoleus sp. FACHB-69]
MHFKSGSLKNAIASLMYFVSVSSTPSSRLENGVLTVYRMALCEDFPQYKLRRGYLALVLLLCKKRSLPPVGFNS